MSKPASPCFSGDSQIRRMAIVFTLTLAIMITSPAISSAQTGDFYPLAIGNRWTYSVTGSEPFGETKVEISSSERVRGTDCFVLRYTVEGKVTIQYYFGWQYRNTRLYIRRAILDHDIVDYSDPLPYLVTPLRIGQAWSWEGRVESQTYGYAYDRLSARVVEKVSIVVPAGTFEAYHIEIDGGRGSATFKGHRWFAQGVGLVREDYTDATVQYKSELVSYFVSGFPLQVTFDIGVTEASRSMTVDGTTYSGTDLPKTSALDYRSTHMVSVAPTVAATASGTRFVFDGWNDGSTDPSRTITVEEGRLYLAKYKTQYLLTVESQYGNPQGGGWYDSGTSAMVYVSPAVPAPGIAGVLGVRYVFVSWQDSNRQYQSSGPSLAVVVDGPQTLKAVWREDYQLVYVVAAAIILLVSVFILWATTKKSGKAKAWFSQPLRSEKIRETAEKIPAPLDEQPIAQMVQSKASEVQKPRARGGTNLPGAMRTVGSVVSLLGLAIMLFTVFRYMPQYSTWAIIGSSALLALYHPWWKRGPKRPASPATTTDIVQQEPVISEVPAGAPPAKFCRKCGAKIPRDSKYCEECGAKLADSESEVQVHPKPAKSPRGMEKTTAGLIIIALVLLWVVLPVFVVLPNQSLDRFLTLTVSQSVEGEEPYFTLVLRNVSPWPISIHNGRWNFVDIQWTGPPPAGDFTLLPFGTFTYDFVVYSSFGPAPFSVEVRFTAEATMLYITDHDVRVTSHSSLFMIPSPVSF